VHFNITKEYCVLIAIFHATWKNSQKFFQAWNVYEIKYTYSKLKIDINSLS
jgi:hypothetical protein